VLQHNTSSANMNNNSSRVAISVESSADPNHFNLLHINLPRYCKYLSNQCFKSAMVLMSPPRWSKRAFTALDNALSPFVLLAMTEGLYHEFRFVDMEISHGSRSLSQIYAQALSDLEQTRQYFVVQIRHNPSSRRRAMNKAV
jgi:hypothetical protein